MNLDINTYIGVGPIKFGMTRNEIRRIICRPAKPFLKGPGSVIPTDAFDDIGMHVYYREGDLCEAVEMFLAADPNFKRQRLTDRPFAQLLT